ncbi:MAG TPA: radical SAM protein [Anaerolineae bacterium]|nr:radical SAM protein [Anaerolineae bacterium]
MFEVAAMLKVFYHKALDLIQRRSVVPAFFDVTSRCNLRCPHCYFFRGKQTADLTVDEWRELFTHYRRAHIRHAVLTGGEPTLRPEIITLADSLFPIVNIATNGLIPVAPEIHHTVFISLDGTEETHDRIRGQGTFRKVMDNYHNDRRAIYRMTINKHNLAEVEPATQAAQHNGVRGISFIIHAPLDTTDALCLTPAELEAVRQTVLGVIRRYGRFVYLTPKMLDAMITSSFGETCKLKGSVALFSDGSPKKCTMNNIDCRACKCPTPALLHTYRRDPRGFLLGLKFY